MNGRGHHRARDWTPVILLPCCREGKRLRGIELSFEGCARQAGTARGRRGLGLRDPQAVRPPPRATQQLRMGLGDGGGSGGKGLHERFLGPVLVRRGPIVGTCACPVACGGTPGAQDGTRVVSKIDPTRPPAQDRRLTKKYAENYCGTPWMSH